MRPAEINNVHYVTAVAQVGSQFAPSLSEPEPLDRTINSSWLTARSVLPPQTSTSSLQSWNGAA